MASRRSASTCGGAHPLRTRFPANPRPRARCAALLLNECLQWLDTCLFRDPAPGVQGTFMWIELPTTEIARSIASRVVLLRCAPLILASSAPTCRFDTGGRRGIFRVFAHGRSYPEVHSNLKSCDQDELVCPVLVLLPKPSSIPSKFR